MMSQSYALVNREGWHAGHEDDVDDNTASSLEASGFIQYALLGLPFLLEQLLSHWKTSSQLSLGRRSFCKSLSTR